MSQKFIKIQNTNSRSSACGKYFAKAVYDKKLLVKDVVFEETHENTVECLAIFVISSSQHRSMSNIVSRFTFIISMKLCMSFSALAQLPVVALCI